MSFEHRNIYGLNRSIVGSVTSSNLLNPQVVADECSFGSFVVLLILVTVTFCHLGLHCIRGYTA